MIWPSKALAVTNKQLYGPPTVPMITFRFALYWWPDRSNAHNTTGLKYDEHLTSHLARPALACIISAANRDGQFVYDQHIVNNGDFSALGDAVMYASWSTITGNDTHAANVAKWIDQRWHCPNTKSYVFLTSCTFFLCLTQLLSC